MQTYDQMIKSNRCLKKFKVSGIVESEVYMPSVIIQQDLVLYKYCKSN